MWEYINPDQEKSNSLSCSIVNRLIQHCYDWAKVKWTRDFGVQAPQNHLRLMLDWAAVSQMWRCASMDINTGHNFMLLLLYDCLLILVDRNTAEGIPAISPSFWYFSLFVHLTVSHFKTHKSETDTPGKKKLGLIIYLWGQNKGVQEHSWEEATTFRLVCYWAIGQAGVVRGSIPWLNGRTACECPSTATHRQNRQLCELLISIKSIPKYLAAF